MTLKTVVIFCVLIAIGSGIAFVVGVGDRADRIALVLLCWSSMSVPVSLFVGNLVRGIRIVNKDLEDY